MTRRVFKRHACIEVINSSDSDSDSSGSPSPVVIDLTSSDGVV